MVFSFEFLFSILIFFFIISVEEVIIENNKICFILFILIVLRYSILFEAWDKVLTRSQLLMRNKLRPSNLSVVAEEPVFQLI